MINDRLIVEERHFNIAKKIRPNIRKGDIVLIYGNSGTGKSEVADCLQGELYNKGISSFSLSLDDFYLVHPTIRNENRRKQGIDSVGLKEIDWDHLTRICQDFKEEKTLYFRRVHKYCDIIEHNSTESDEVDVMIIEGLYSGYLKGHGNFAVFLEGNPNQTLAFRQKRKKENPDDEFRIKVVQKEFNVICQLKKHADLVIPFEEQG